jgi:hypothetical protein
MNEHEVDGVGQKVAKQKPEEQARRSTRLTRMSGRRIGRGTVLAGV